jgi:hypothetical protein
VWSFSSLITWQAVETYWLHDWRLQIASWALLFNIMFYHYYANIWTILNQWAKSTSLRAAQLSAVNPVDDVWVDLSVPPVSIIRRNMYHSNITLLLLLKSLNKTVRLLQEQWYYQEQCAGFFFFSQDYYYYLDSIMFQGKPQTVCVCACRCVHVCVLLCYTTEKRDRRDS